MNVEEADFDRIFSETIHDASVAAAVKAALAVQKGVRVRARRGTVTLYGTVVTQTEKNLAESAARKVVGVKELENKLDVLSSSE